MVTPSPVSKLRLTLWLQQRSPFVRTLRLQNSESRYRPPMPRRWRRACHDFQVGCMAALLPICEQLGLPGCGISLFLHRCAQAPARLWRASQRRHAK